MSDQESNETPAETPTETPTETPAETPTETPTETPAETPTETPTETTAPNAVIEPGEPGAAATQGGGDERALRKTRVGVVVSDGMEKTIVVQVTRRVPHPRFKKIIKRSSKFYAHDEKGGAKLGDKVRIIEIRPMSKLKRWRLIEVLDH